MRIGRGATLGLTGTLVVGILSLIFGRNLFNELDMSQQEQVVEPGQSSPQEDELKQFASFVLDDVQQTWRSILGERYRDAKMVLFTDAVRSGCGVADAQVGPFYCPSDEKAYIDLSFYDALRQRFGAPGDFAQAYVIAHEIGHHVQHILGVERETRRGQSENPEQANALSVQMELQADCLAGVWAHTTQARNLLEKGDTEEALNAAAAIGDDRIQRKTQGHVQPETWTHGSSEQRLSAFARGMEAGQLEACNL